MRDSATAKEGHRWQALTLVFITATGNFPTVTRVLLAKIPSQDGRMTYVYDNYTFHYGTSFWLA